MEMQRVHEEVYRFLIEQRKFYQKKYDRPLNFTFRKSNYGGRLEEGYWFYGNDQYLAVSFWSGMDWRNRTPNIIFVIDKNGQCSLEFNCTDSHFKQEFVEVEFASPLFLHKTGRRYVKEYRHDYLYGNELHRGTSDKPDYIRFLDFFIHDDKVLIDEVINRSRLKYREQSDAENAISFIPNEEFKKRHDKVRKYRKAIEELERDLLELPSAAKPFKLKSIKLFDYGLIRNLCIDVDSSSNQWIFITGENGSGKTNILRGIGTYLGNRVLSDKELGANPNFKIEATFYDTFKEKYSRNLNEEAKGKRKPLVRGLAMYGPYRLDIVEDKITKKAFYEKLNKLNSFNSLFESGEKLLSIEKQFKLWREGNSREKDFFERRMYYFSSVLVAITPGLVDVRFKDENNKFQKTIYVFESLERERRELTWDQLSTGSKSTVTMLGDILIRLYDQQRDVTDPSELKGVVIIDEIDLHLHPKAQKDLVINLSEVFPDVQFIASTHSPIPFLGAPKESVFYNVSSSDASITVEKLYIQFQQLLPNTLLTSPLFGMDDLTNPEYDEMSLLKSEDNYNEALFYSILDKKVKNTLDKAEDEED